MGAMRSRIGWASKNSRLLELARVFARLDQVAITYITHFRIFPRNLAPDFTHYFSERPEMVSELLHATSRQRKYQLRHKRAGLCYDCSRPVASGTSFCELHRRRRNLRNRERQRKIYKRKIRYLKAESYGFSNF